MKSVQKLLSSTRPHWVGDGFNVFPVFNELAFTNDISPFLMLDYGAPKEFKPTSRKLGVGQHPHRGFETVTIAFHGEVEHGDSEGHHDIIGPGDVQWMTAGSGIIHEEFHSSKIAKEGGMFEMVQLWVNLPSQHKMAKPRYQPLLKNDIPTVKLANDAGNLRVIAGDYLGNIGKAVTFSPINVWDVLVVPGSTIELNLPENHNTILFVRRGFIVVVGEDSVNECTIGESRAALLTTAEAKLVLKVSKPFAFNL